RYFYWDEVIRLPQLPIDDPKKAWELLKLYRKGQSKVFSFGREAFSYCETAFLQKSLHDLDRQFPEDFGVGKQVANSALQVEDEAIASSQVAVDMLQSGRKPKNESEQMIFNNSKAMHFMVEAANRPLDRALLLELHKILIAETSASTFAGQLRQGEVYVLDHTDGEMAHIPPDFKAIYSWVDDLCSFANSECPFLHPIVKASMLHFMVGYIHPFADGNGRTARALFYWFLIRHRYSAIQFISLSRIIQRARVQYDKAFLKTELDGKDLTYFIYHSLKCLRLGFEHRQKVQQQQKEQRNQSAIIAFQLMQKGFNKRQGTLIGALYTQVYKSVNISTYAELHQVVWQTARKDLEELSKAGLIQAFKSGREMHFRLTTTKSVDAFLP
ncbi:MAG: Fic family protein, partial [Salibacteraceae bacterium]